MEKVFNKKSLYELPSVWRHIAGWVLFIGYETGYILLIQGSYAGTMLSMIPYYVINIGLFYFNYYSFNFSFSKKKYTYPIIVALIVVELVVYILIKIGIDKVMLPTASFDRLLFKSRSSYITLNMGRAAYFLVLSFIYWSITRMSKYREAVNKADKQTIILLNEKAGLEKNLSDTRFAYYQQQINPHFLFNTLNFIYNSVYKHSKQASNAIVLLSDIMRYSLDDMDIGGKAPIEREVEQIENLIEINRLRYDYDLYVNFEIEGDYEHVKFIPLILLTFAENVFKYGNLKDAKNPALLKLTVANETNQLIFETWNTKKTRNLIKDSTGIGLKNTIQRLEYNYPNNFTLDTNNESSHFYLKLTVNL